MATPQGMARGMSRGSRDLGPLPPGAQEGLQGDIPPGFTYTQIESMVRELRTAAALEVNLQMQQSFMDSLQLISMQCQSCGHAIGVSCSVNHSAHCTIARFHGMVIHSCHSRRPDARLLSETQLQQVILTCSVPSNVVHSQVHLLSSPTVSFDAMSSAYGLACIP